MFLASQTTGYLAEVSMWNFVEAMISTCLSSSHKEWCKTSSSFIQHLFVSNCFVPELHWASGYPSQLDHSSYLLGALQSYNCRWDHYNPGWRGLRICQALWEHRIKEDFSQEETATGSGGGGRRHRGLETVQDNRIEGHSRQKEELSKNPVCFNTHRDSCHLPFSAVLCSAESYVSL